MKQREKSTKSIHWMINPLECSQTDAARIFGITPQGLGMWLCPRNENKSYSLIDLWQWREGKLNEKPENRVELENQKLTLQIESLSLSIERMKSESIALETHKQILAGRAMSLKNYIMEFFAKNVHLFAHKSVEQLRPFLQEAAAAMLNHYSQNHR